MNRGELLGREREIAQGDRFLEDVLAGRGRSLLILGEPGIGKTVLAQAIAKRAQNWGLESLSGRASELQGAPPLWIWAPILRGLIRFQQAGGERAVTTVLHRVAESAVGGSSPQVEDRFEIFDAVARAAESVSSGKPLLIVLDDLHWADDLSWELAASLVRFLSGIRVGLLITCREDEAVRGEAKATLLASLSRECTVIYPPALDAVDAERMFVAKGGRRLRPNEVDQLLRSTGGNPLLIEEFARLAADNEKALISDLVSHRTGRITRQRIAERVRRLLGERATEVIEAISVFGSGAKETDLRELLRGDLMEHAEVAMKAGVLILNSDRSLTFAHDMMREAIYETIPAAHRASLHARCAEVLRRRAGLDRRVVYEAASHYLHSGSEHDKVAAEFALAAGRRALDSFAPELGLSYLSQGLERVPADDPAMKCDMQIAYIEALVRSGRRNEASGFLLEAAETAMDLDDAERLATALIAYGESFYRAGVPIEMELQGLLEEALERLAPAAKAQRAILLADLAARKNFGQGKDGRQEAQEAVALAREAEDEAALARALLSASYTAGPDRVDEAISAMDEVVEIGRRRGNSDLIVIGCSCRAAFHLENGSMRAFEENLETVGGVASRTRATMHLWSSLTLQALLALIRGELNDCARLSQDALALAPNHPGALTAWFLDLWQRSDLTEVETGPVELFEGIRAQARWTRQLRAPRCGWVHILAVDGRIEDARAELRVLLEEVATWPKDMLWLVSLGWLANAAALSRTRDECAQLYRLLVPYEKRVLYTNVGVPTGYMGTVAAVLGSLQEVLGDEELSLRHYELAEAIQGSIGDRGWITKVKLDRARVLARIGKVAEARRAAGEAQSLAAEKGFSKVHAEANVLIATLDSPSGRVLDFRFEEGAWSVGDLRLKDMRGLRYIVELLKHPDQPIHALELTAIAAGVPRMRPKVGERSPTGDTAAAVLDDQAKSAYRERLHDLYQDIEDAETGNDIERASRLREELDFVTAELAAAVGLGGRDRKLGSEAERARVAVTKAIRFALDRIQQGDEALGEYLRATIRTGTFCVFEPRSSLPGYRPISIST